MANACNDQKCCKRRMVANIWRAHRTLGFTCLCYTCAFCNALFCTGATCRAPVLNPLFHWHKRPKPLGCCFSSLFYTKAITKTTTAWGFIYWCSCRLLDSCLQASISVSGEWLSKTQKLCDLQGSGRWHSFIYLYLVWGVISSVTLLPNHSNQYPDLLVQTRGYGF